MPRPRPSRASATLVVRLGRACRACRVIACRSLAHWLRDVEEGGGAIQRYWSRLVGRPLPLLGGGRRSTLARKSLRWSDAGRKRWAATAVMVDARCAMMRALAARLSPRRAPCDARESRGGAAGRPPIRRVSDDVTTAGLISSRVWFGPVSGSP
ncbi:hypothetical protein F511_45415 [Dorcoceras hygrometricum]|uniref:Uncharacterized protein n=1 Tax=Dorcoceras hygrometricum TaxID=472368 RepID=A0A2Z6ZX81_9LAMI|nr:hypothetical protein F511_45415 [Dorcoceras hygrometricum]